MVVKFSHPMQDGLSFDELSPMTFYEIRSIDPGSGWHVGDLVYTDSEGHRVINPIQQTHLSSPDWKNVRFRRLKAGESFTVTL